MDDTDDTSQEDMIAAGYSRMKRAHANIAMTMFIVSGIYHHVRFGGFGSLFTIKSFLFFVIGMFVAPLTIGVATYSLQRLIGKLPVDPFNRSTLAVLQLLGIGLFVFQVVVAWLATRWAYLWLYASAG